MIPILFLGVQNALACDPGRQVIQENGQSFYVVGERAPSLYMISRDLYGYDKNWRHIARWNHLSAPYTLELGQKLLIKVPPHISEQKASRILISSWKKLKKPEMAQRLACEEPPTERETASAPTELPAVVAPAISIAPPPPPPATPSVVVAQKPVPPPAIEERAPSSWILQSELITSFFTLHNKNQSEGIDNRLHSKFNYGVDLSLGYKICDGWKFFLGAGVEHVDFEPPTSSDIADDKKNLFHYFLKTEIQIAEPFVIDLTAQNIQRPFSRPTGEGTTIDAVYLREYVIGPQVRVLNFRRSEAWITAEAIISMSNHTADHDIKTGHGYSGGIKWNQQIHRGQSVLTLAAVYRHLQEDTEIEENRQNAGLFTLGFSY